MTDNLGNPNKLPVQVSPAERVRSFFNPAKICAYPYCANGTFRFNKDTYPLEFASLVGMVFIGDPLLVPFALPTPLFVPIYRFQMGTAIAHPAVHAAMYGQNYSSAAAVTLLPGIKELRIHWDTPPGNLFPHGRMLARDATFFAQEDNGLYRNGELLNMCLQPETPSSTESSLYEAIEQKVGSAGLEVICEQVLAMVDLYQFS